MKVKFKTFRSLVALILGALGFVFLIVGKDIDSHFMINCSGMLIMWSVIEYIDIYKSE